MRTNLNDNSFSDAKEDNIEVNQIEEKIESTTISDDGVFKVTVGPAPITLNKEKCIATDTMKLFRPSARINCGLAIKHGILYLYGGMFEDGDKQVTFSDLYSLDLKKLDEWKTIIADDTRAMEWLGSDSEEGEESVHEEESDEDESDDSAMETD